MKKKRLPKRLWVLFDGDGVDCGSFLTRKEAEAEAWGPRFRLYTIRCYKLVAKGKP
jgi:hypothetical protein